MPRAARAVFLCGVGLCIFAGVPVAGASTPAHTKTAGSKTTASLVDQLSGARSAGSKNDAAADPRNPSSDPAGGASRVAARNADSKPGSVTVEKPERAPARQVPVEPIVSSAEPDDFEASEHQIDESAGNAGSQVGEVNGDAGQTPPVKAAATPAPGTVEETTRIGPQVRKPLMQPGLPVRKPRKPAVRRELAAGKSEKKRPSSRSERDKKLCRVLQSCRNNFVKCKGKIKYPDQSEPWIIAKEECGAVYKTCVAKDFRAGEWTLTRWFYFGELQCK